MSANVPASGQPRALDGHCAAPTDWTNSVEKSMSYSVKSRPISFT